MSEKQPLLSRLRPGRNANRSKKRVGRGPGSGLGKTAGRGQKGQKSRNTGLIGKIGFEGGQTPIFRRLPKVGFRRSKPEFSALNVDAFNRFDEGSTIDLQALKNAGLIKKKITYVKVLGEGKLEKNLTIKVQGFSASASEKIKSAGGEAVVES